MKKLYIKRKCGYDYAGGKDPDGFIIVDDPRDDEWYAHVWSMDVVKIVKRALEKGLK